MSTTLTQQQALQQIVAALREAEKDILPAKLVNPAQQGHNGHALAGYLTKHGLQPSKENFAKAIRSLYASLEWVVKPAKLVLEEGRDKPPVITSAIESERDFTARVRAGEAADAKKALDDASIKQCRELVAGYNPASRGRYDAREREDMQKHWTKQLNEAIEKKENMQTFAKALAEVIQRRYAERERAQERM